MSTLTLRIDEEKHARLRRLAALHGVSMNRLMDELATIALSQHDAETRFRARTAKGSTSKGLKALAKLDRHFATTAGR
ncbi:MAG: toxin-antitoxin system HicB family antitoxin [Bryobacteraceae bacterium]